MYGCPDRMDPSCTRCQRLCEYGDNWFGVNISGFHISQILCQSDILGALTFHCRTFLIISYRNYICLFFIVALNKRWLLRLDPISNRQSVTGCSHWLFNLFSQICCTLCVSMKTVITYSIISGSNFLLCMSEISMLSHWTQLLPSSHDHHFNFLHSTFLTCIFPHSCFYVNRPRYSSLWECLHAHMDELGTISSGPPMHKHHF